MPNRPNAGHIPVPNLRGVAPNEVDVAIRDAYNYISELRALNESLRRRVTTLERTPPNIQIIRNELQATGSAPLNVQNLLGQLSTAQSATIIGPHIQRLAAPTSNKVDGTVWFETDRASLYVIISNQWYFMTGMFSQTLANIPTDLGVRDEGFLFYGTDYHHTWRWEGSGWAYAPGDDGSNWIRVYRTGGPLVPAAATSAWQVCDGSNVARTNSDATTTNVTVPDVSGGAYLKYESAYGGVQSASGTTDDESSHTHSINHDHPQGSTGQHSDTFDATVDANLDGTTVVVSEDEHTHLFDMPNFNGSSGAGTAHNHGPGTLELDRLEALAYFRR